MSSIPDIPAGPDIKVSDKVLHVCEYFVWGLLLRRAIDVGLTGSSLAKALATIIVGAALCFTDESFQRTVGRNYSYYDMAADLIGVSLAQLAWILIRRLFPADRTGRA